MQPQYTEVDREDFGTIMVGDDIIYTGIDNVIRDGGFVLTVDRDNGFFMVRIRSGKGEFKLMWDKIRELSRLLTRVDISLAKLALAVQELRDAI